MIAKQRRIEMLRTLLLGAAMLLSSAAFAEGDPAKGQMAFRKCQACHTLDGKNRVGPTLAGIVGRRVASVENFRYSAAMTGYAEDGKVWDAEHLAQFLTAPKATVSGTSMAFAGIKKPEELADLIAFLKTVEASD
jgi:cytochrome c